MFSLQGNQKTGGKHIILIKKVVWKMIRKLGLPYMKVIIPAEHHKLITYIERDKRKKQNKMKKHRLQQLLGKDTKVEKKEDVDMGDDEEGSESEEENQYENEENYSLDSDLSSESEDEDLQGVDHLMTTGIDIPRVNDIPVVSKLAKDTKKTLNKEEQLRFNRDKIASMIEAENEELETHFVDNPFIKIRERALKKTLDAKLHLG